MCRCHYDGVNEGEWVPQNRPNGFVKTEEKMTQKRMTCDQDESNWRWIENFGLSLCAALQ